MLRGKAQAARIDALRADIQRLKDLLDKNSEDARQALERIQRTDPSDHDWRAEASGLAYMICQIRDDYIFAKQGLGGDSEFLANSIMNAYRWVDGQFRTFFEAALSNGEECSVPGCQFPRLASGPCCYGHTVDESDPRHIPARIDGSLGGSEGLSQGSPPAQGQHADGDPHG